MSPIPKPTPIPDQKKRLAATHSAMARERCVFWFLLTALFFGVGVFIVQQSILLFIILAFTLFITCASRNRITRLKELEWMRTKDLLRAENSRDEIINQSKMSL